MLFCEKLDFLMNITKTTNSALSLNTNLDPSHISRLRNGRRNASKNRTFIKAMAEYFAKRCTEDYQRKAVLNTVNVNLSSPDQDFAKLLYDWLNSEHLAEVKRVEDFISVFSKNNTSRQTVSAYSNTQNKSPVEVPHTAVSIYYGIEGKRQAVLCFLSEVLASPRPQTLLLFSDEATDWMKADMEFAAQWASLMSQVIAHGNKIKIIHTVERNLDEMLGAINQWVPLYMSGAIEPYFYPKKRDGVFKRTLFIAPASAAVISSSVGNIEDQTANLFIKNKKAIKAYTEEFNQYLALCKPLMRIFMPEDEQAYLATMIEFEKEQTNTIIKTESLSLLTIPENVAEKIINRYHSNKDIFTEYFQLRTDSFIKNIQKNSLTEIIQLPPVDTVINEKVKVTFSDMLNRNTAYYTVEEFILHIENIIQILLIYKNYHICLCENSSENNFMIYAKEDLGTIIAKTSAPAVIIALNESNMTAAFWDYLRNLIGFYAYRNLDNQAVANILRDYIQKIKQNQNNH